MDSQLTLVHVPGPTPSKENIVLIFDRDDMMNTTLRIRGTYLPSYFVDTLDNTTTIRTGDYLLATFTRRKFRPDQITFPGHPPMKLGSWLKSPTLLSSPLEFRACGRRFEWRQDLLGQVVLCESGRPGNHLAWFSKSRRNLGPRDCHMMHAAYLAIKPEVVEMTDMIVLSCLLVGQKLRVMHIAGQWGETVWDMLVLPGSI
ncbi:hypothetical protein OG21DRAFT_1520355 [Imleria badia]|nr:hypothetical protein OG21DRAFT_1520355 [Imleria badia]